MSPFTLKIRQKVAEIESVVNNNPCDSLNSTQSAEGSVLLGSTGGGKTTLLEFFLDQALTVKMRYGNPYLDSKSDCIGHGGQAKTDQVMIYTYDKNQIFIDTPGFGDTRGEYTEIKNHIAIRNIIECDKISGIRMVFVVPKSFIFYEANRGTDLIKFVKAIRNFIPDFSAKKWIDQTLIIVTKTESRTKTNHAIEAIRDGITEIQGTKDAVTFVTNEEKAFFKYLTDNQKVKLFPMPQETYVVNTVFNEPDLRKDILSSIKSMPVVKVSKEDFKKDFQVLMSGEIIDDFNHGKYIFIINAEATATYVEENIKNYLKLFPNGNLITIPYKSTRKSLKDFLEHLSCNQDQKYELFKAIPDDFNKVNRLVSDFCELDYSVKFLKKYTFNRENLFTIESERKKLIEIIEKIITYCDCVICTTNAYSTFFKFLIQKDKSTSGDKNIDTLLKQNIEGYKFFGHSTEEDVRKTIFDSCTQIENPETAKQTKQKLLDLSDNNRDSNALDKLVKLVNGISKGGYPHYNQCKLKGFMPTIAQYILDHDGLRDCTEIAIYGVYGIKIEGPLDLIGKNLIMIAPYIRIIENQKIKLDGQTAPELPQIQDNNGNDGAPGNLGGNGGSFLTYSFEVGGGKLTISTKGGNGSNGQNGAKGKNGSKGATPPKDYLLDSNVYDKGPAQQIKHKPDHQGWTWYEHIRCTDAGQEGETGGQGGTGGEGGKGGIPGTIDFQIKGPIKDKEKYYSTITSEGLQGKNGEPGKGGQGGEHADALCYIVQFVDTYFPWQINPIYGSYKLFGNVPEVKLHKNIPLPSQGNSNTYNNLEYPPLKIHERAPDGSIGSNVPKNKSKIPSKNQDIDKTKHINEYLDFISKVQNIKNLLTQEDAYGISLSSDNEEILEFFANLYNENCKIVTSDEYV